MTSADSAGEAPALTSATGRRRRWPWLVAAIVLLAGGGAALAYWFLGPEPAGPLDGMLAVYVRGAERAAEALPVEEPGALPARAGGIMALDVRLNRPVFTYLVWLDAEGRAVPLYPWNYNQPEITDINAPPPKRIATKMLMSPPLGGGWPFNEHSGMETVLFLVRATPLPEGTGVGKLLGQLPPPVEVRDPKELLILEVRDQAQTVTTITSKNRRDEKAAAAADEPLKAMLQRLSPHFDLVRAVRFAHVADDGKPVAAADSPAER